MQKGGNGHGRMILPGQGVPQGQVLGQGGLDPKELELRHKLEYNLVLASNLQQSLAMSGDLVKKYKETGNYDDVPEGSRHLAEALAVHEDLAEMQLRMLRTLRGQFKRCAPFKGMQDLKFTDTEDVKEV